MRLDGAWINSKMNSVGKNSKISRQLKKCNGVIYQSNFCKKACRKFIGKSKKYSVIFNGCNPALFKNKYEHHRPYVLTLARWRPHKRLKTTVDGFLESGIYNEYDLIVCGRDPDYVIKNPHVHYFGHKSTADTQRIIAGCKFVVHLSYLDWCPNSIVESLVAGKRVMCSDVGGPPEIVGDSGILIKDKPYNFRMLELYNPPQMDMNEIAQAYISLSNSDDIEPRKDLFIRRTASRYIKFMKTFL